MHHLAIMNPKWKLIPKILSGQKTIESRWYRNRIAPWDRIKTGDIVFFKDAGKAVSAKAVVSRVLQGRINSVAQGMTLAKKHANQLCLTESAFSDTSWLTDKNYVILVFLEKPQMIAPFHINKAGYGSACAWICVENIDTITRR